MTGNMTQIGPVGPIKPADVWHGEAPDPKIGYTDLPLRPIALATLELADERLRLTPK